MSYEFKDEIIEDIKAHCKTKNKNIAVYPVYHYEDKVEEIHNVYSQAAKADDYEAKAEALDAIMREWEDERMTKSHILETIQKYYDEYESGGLDV